MNRLHRFPCTSSPDLGSRARAFRPQHFAASGGDEKLTRALAPYAGDKGTMRFPLDEPMPYPLIARIIKARLKEGRAWAKAKEAAPCRW